MLVDVPITDLIDALEREIVVARPDDQWALRRAAQAMRMLETWQARRIEVEITEIEPAAGLYEGYL